MPGSPLGWIVSGAVLLAVVVLGFVGSVLAAGLYLTAPFNRAVGPAPAGFEAVAFRSGSGAELRGWWASGAAGRGVVVLMHGYRSTRTSLTARALVLREHGFGVLLFDFQANGESEGGRVTVGKKEALDAAAAVAVVRLRAPGERVGAIGISMGGAAAVVGTAPLAVDALVLESVYPDIGSALSHRLHSHLGPMLGGVMTPVLTAGFELLLPPLIGVRPDELRPVDHVGSIKAPVLIAAGTADEHTPVEEARTLFERAPEPKRFWAVAGAGHVDLEAFGPEAYWREVLPFLEQHLRR